MTPARLPTVLALALCACGGPTPARLESPPRQPQIIPEPQMPPAPRDHLVGDGHGPSAREAVLDARRAVAEQINARISARSDAEERERDGVGERNTEVQISSTSRFEHAELLQTLAVERGPEGFVARVVLDRERVARLYREQISAAQARLDALAPILAQAAAELDTAVLLSAEHAPEVLRARQRVARRALATLGREGAAVSPEPEGTAAARAARHRAVIRLQVVGEVSPALRTGVVGALSQQLANRGCRFVEAPFTEPEPGRPTADARLEIAVRAQGEGGLDWRYLGLDLRITDARSGQPVFTWTAMPSLAHGGGLTPARAEEAVVRRLRELLPSKAGPTFARLNCR